VIYERVVELDGTKHVVAAWILSLDPQFDYMRKPMCMKANGFIYTFDITDITGKTLSYLDPFVKEVRDMYRVKPPEILVGSHPDPTISAKPEKTNSFVRAWLAAHDNIPFLDLDLTDKKKFFDDVEAIFARALSMIHPKQGGA
jgi:hypothetical protein